MLIALLAVLGVDLIVIVAVAGAMLTRRRWVKRQRGAFKGAVRVTEGEVPGLGAKWTRGYGRWVGDVLVWTKAPFFFRNELVAIDGLAGEIRPASPGEVKRIGRDPIVAPLAADGAARAEVATAHETPGAGPRAVRGDGACGSGRIGSDSGRTSSSPSTQPNGQGAWSGHEVVRSRTIAAPPCRRLGGCRHPRPGRTAIPLEQAHKSSLRDRVSTANKSNVDAVADEVTAALATLDPDDKDHARLQGWLEDLSVVKGGGVPGKF